MEKRKQAVWKKIILTLAWMLLVIIVCGMTGCSDWQIAELEVAEQGAAENTGLPEAFSESDGEGSGKEGSEPEESEPEESEPEEQEESVPRMSNEERKAVLLEGGYLTDVEERTIVIPGLRKTYYFLYLSDMHILVENEEVAEKDRETVKSRAEEFMLDGKASGEIFDHIVEAANGIDLDGVLLGGDMIDFLSEANADRLNGDLEKLEIPYLYVTADHDLDCWWTDHSKEKQLELQEKLHYEAVPVLDCGELLVVGVGNSTSQLTKETLEKLKMTFGIGKPVLLVQHVPMDFGMDEELRKVSEQNWEGRVLLWGAETNYRANEVTQEYLELVNAQNSPVVAVFAGHLHLRHEGMLNGRIRQYLFNPAYTGEVAVLTVTGHVADDGEDVQAGDGQ